MTGAMIAMMLVAVLFTAFGLLRRHAAGGQACEGCAGGCSECAAVLGAGPEEVNRVRK